MAVSNYTTNSCKFFNWNLSKEVYLVNYDSVSGLYIDNGEAYVNFSGDSIGVSVSSINVEETETLDERYAFTHTVTFTVNGYANKSMFMGNYYVVIKNEEDSYWLINPFFPCKVSYEFTYSFQLNQTTFTANTISNLPIVKLNGFEGDVNYQCDGYKLSGVKHLLLNERMYSMAGESTIEYTNDGFKIIVPEKNSCVFKETFDGNNHSQELSFTIPFSSYKTSWHYNLLEFTKNKYSSVIVTKDNDWILSGFDFGLQPSFEIAATNSKEEPTSITITLSNIGNLGNTIRFVEGGMQVALNDDVHYIYTSKHNGWKCVDDQTAMYLLQEEVDAIGTSTGNYLAYEGYEDQFPQLTIIGTFDDIVTFTSTECSSHACKVVTNIPNTMTFRNQNEDVVYNMQSNAPWRIESSSEYITVSPSAGTENTLYQVHFTNTYNVQPNTYIREQLSAITCGDNVKVYNVIISRGSECFTSGLQYNVSANGQTLKIPFNCCLSSYTSSSSAIHSFQYLVQRYLSFYVDENRTGSARTMTVNVVYCDGGSGSISVVQSANYERWVTEGSQCNNGEKCDFQRKYSGITSDDVNTPTDETRFVNCSASTECSDNQSRWIATTGTVCYDNDLFYIEREEISYNGGLTWSDSGRKRLGELVEDGEGSCLNDSAYSEWRVVGGEYLCDGMDKYQKTRKWVSNDEVNWYATDIYKLGDLIETDSADCGYEMPTRWWRFEYWVATEGYICDDGNKYEKLQRMVSMNQATWVALDVYKKGSLIDSNSVDCGFYPAYYDYEYSKYVDEGDYTCNNTSKYEYLRKYYSHDNINWIQTDIYKVGDLIEQYSPDCGYVYESNYIDWRVVSGQYLCDGGNKYQKLQRYVSENSRDYYPTDIYKLGNLLESNSTDCGALVQTEWEYQWVLTEETQCGYESQEPYTFTFSGGSSAITSSVSYLDTSVTATVVSEQGDELVSFQVTNIPEWIHNVEVEGDTVTATFGSNPTYGDRTAQITLLQNISGKVLYIYITQGAYSYDGYVFTWGGGGTGKTISVLSDASGYTTDVVSTSGGSEMIGCNYYSKPDWVSSVTYTRLSGLLEVEWTENTSGSLRSGDIVLKQYNSDKTITLTIIQHEQGVT